MPNVKRNWITTIFGILSLVMTGLQIAQNPATSSDPNVLGQIAVGVGLIAAKDANKTGVNPPTN